MTEMGWYKELELGFDAAVPRVKELLQKEGFGVLSEIRVDEKFRDKLGKEFPRYLILGACNPGLAHVALSTERDIGLLLPCNVTLEDLGERTRVGIVQPRTLTTFWADNADVCRVADDATERLQRVYKEL